LEQVSDLAKVTPLARTRYGIWGKIWLGGRVDVLFIGSREGWFLGTLLSSLEGRKKSC
jgi:hypothetical protein